MKRADLYSYSEGDKFKGKSTKEIFSDIEKNNTWLEKESVSGIGSSLIQTKEIIIKLPSILKELNINTIFDIPCGDFNWFKNINLSKMIYLGGDIVENIVTRNNQFFGKSNVSFINFNLIEDKIDLFDLIFCRDCLVHFSIEDILRTIKNVKNSKSKYLITTTFPDEDNNTNIQTGGWRPINLEKAPFNFPEPKYLLNEKCTEMDDVFKDKSLGVWEIKKI